MNKVKEESNIHPPEELKVSGDVRENWRVFRREFEQYLCSAGLDGEDDRRKLALLLTVAGAPALQVYNQLLFKDGEKEQFPAVMSKFEDYFTPGRNGRCERERKAEDQQDEDRPYIKRPPNAFMLYVKEHRQKVMAELNIRNNAEVNAVLGQRWKSLTQAEKAKYYDLADAESRLHAQQHPDWSGRDNYGRMKKRRTAATRTSTVAATPEAPQQAKRMCVLMERERHHTAVRSQQSVGDHHHLPRGAQVGTDISLVLKHQGAGEVVYKVAAPSTSAILPPNTSTSKERKAEDQQDEDRPYIKRPPNAFMLYVKEHRQKVMAELNIRNNAEVNAVLGQRWKSLTQAEKAKYYQLADAESQLHAQQHPDWSGRDNYGKKKKRRTAATRTPTVAATPEAPQQAKRMCVLMERERHHTAVRSQQSVGDHHHLQRGAQVSTDISLVLKHQGAGEVVYKVAAPSTSAILPPNTSTSKERKAEDQQDEDRPYIKKPPNAFMLYVKERRQKVMAELNIRNNAEVNAVLGQRWKSLTQAEKAKYYQLADAESQLHAQQHPDWSGRDNYGRMKKRRTAATRTSTVDNQQQRVHLEEEFYNDQQLYLHQQQVHVDDEVLADLQHLKQERNSSLDQEGPEPLQLKKGPEPIQLKEDSELVQVKVDPESLQLKEDPEALQLKEDTELVQVKVDPELVQVKVDPELVQLKEDPEPLQLEEELRPVPEGDQLGLKQETEDFPLIPSAATPEAPQQAKRMCVLMERERHHTAVRSQQSVGDHHHLPRGAQVGTDISLVLKHQGAGEVVYKVAAPSTSAILPPNTSTSKERKAEDQQDEDRPYIKRPPNAFMLYVKEHRQNVVAELNIRNNAEVNAVLGQRWKSLTQAEKTKYYNLADAESRLHGQQHPDWSGRDNYGRKKKRTAATRASMIAATPEAPQQAKRMCVLMERERHHTAVRSQQSVGDHHHLPRGAQVGTDISLVLKHQGAGEVVYKVAAPSTSAILPPNTSTSKERKAEDQQDEDRPYIKRPPNAFMLYVKEHRQKVMAELNIRNNAEVNAVLGQRWKSLTQAEKAKYYQLADFQLFTQIETLFA
ncbi:uncharacterized protein ACBR49_018085 [Aulostomus maculatus]